MHLISWGLIWSFFKACLVGHKKSARHTTLEGDPFSRQNCPESRYRDSTKNFPMFQDVFHFRPALMHSYFAAISYKPYFMITENLTVPTTNGVEGVSPLSPPCCMLLHSVKWQLPNKNLSIAVPMLSRRGFTPYTFPFCYEYSCLLPYQDFNSRVPIRSGGSLFPSVISTLFHFPTKTSRVQYP